MHSEGRKLQMGSMHKAEENLKCNADKKARKKPSLYMMSRFLSGHSRSIETKQKFKLRPSDNLLTQRKALILHHRCLSGLFVLALGRHKGPLVFKGQNERWSRGLKKQRRVRWQRWFGRLSSEEHHGHRPAYSVIHG
jgi:hypothetical protein